MKKENNYTLEDDNLARVRVVMVSTTEPGNIGAAARALKNMALSTLYLVNPSNFPCAAATARASGADDVLQNCVVCNSLEEAISGCNLVIGASARQRSIKWQQVDAQEACVMIEQTINTNQQEVAVVFGTENSGLTNAELDLCQVLMTIPANPAYSSLNIAQAVQVFSYQLHQQYIKKQTTTKPDTQNFASADELAYFYEHLEQVLVSIGYMDVNRPSELLMRRLRKIFHRTNLYKDEVAIFRGILSKIESNK